MERARSERESTGETRRFPFISRTVSVADCPFFSADSAPGPLCVRRRMGADGRFTRARPVGLACPEAARVGCPPGIRPERRHPPGIRDRQSLSVGVGPTGRAAALSARPPTPMFRKGARSGFYVSLRKASTKNGLRRWRSLQKRLAGLSSRKVKSAFRCDAGRLVRGSISGERKRRRRHGVECPVQAG